MLLLLVLLSCCCLSSGMNVASVQRRVAAVGGVRRRFAPVSLVADDPLTAMKSAMAGSFYRLTDFRVARASHILLKGYDDATVQQMEAWKAEIANDPEKFAEIASQSSLCPSRRKGGDLGFFTRGKSARTGRSNAQPPTRICHVPAAHAHGAAG